MSLRLDELPDGGVPLFHAPDFERWVQVGRLRSVRFCFVECDDCGGAACMVCRPDFVKASQDAGIYDPRVARDTDERCRTCAVRIQWKNGSSRTYLCYPHRDLIACVPYGPELEELKTLHRGSLNEHNRVCRHACPRSYCRLYPEILPYSLRRGGFGDSVAARSYGDEPRRPSDGVVASLGTRRRRQQRKVRPRKRKAAAAAAKENGRRSGARKTAKTGEGQDAASVYNNADVFKRKVVEGLKEALLDIIIMRDREQ